MKKNKLIMSMLLVSFFGLSLTMEESSGTIPVQALVCKNAVLCDFTNALRKKYSDERFPGAPESWKNPKQEVADTQVHNEIISFALTSLPFPLTDSSGQEITVTTNQKSGNPTIEVKNSPDYVAAKKVLEPFNGSAGLRKAKRIIADKGSLDLVVMYNIINQPYCSECSMQPTDRK